jgi:tetratricopeptide (TPR) repeat protein
MAGFRDENDYAYLPNGELNAPYILANADLLVKHGEYLAAAKLFRLLKDHPRLAHCAHYGMGQCLLKSGKPELALQAYEKALSIQKRDYIAQSLIQALIACGEYAEAEQRSFDFARDFASSEAAVESFRSLHRSAAEALRRER